MKISRYSIWTQILTFTFSPPVAGPAWECPAPPRPLCCTGTADRRFLAVPGFADMHYAGNMMKYIFWKYRQVHVKTTQPKKSNIFKVPILTGIAFGLFMGFLVFMDRRTNAMDLQGLFRLKKLFVFSLGIVDCCLSPDIVIVWWWLINAGRSVRRGARSAHWWPTATCHGEQSARCWV